MTERPGAAKYLTATKATNHKAACTELGFTGVAIKQRAKPWSEGYTNPGVIAIGEQFVMRVRGQHEFPNTGISGATQGQAVYIVAATNALTLTASGNVPFGYVAELPGGNRGVPTGRLRIDIERKPPVVA